MDKFEQKEMMKKRPLIKNTWNDWLISYIPEPMKKDKIMSLFKTNTTKDYSTPTRIKNEHDGGQN